MATTESGVQTLHAATTSTTAETWGFSRPAKQVRVTNRDGTNTVYVTIATGKTAAAAEADIVTAVAAADETFVVPPSTSKVIFKSPRASFVAGSIIGNASDYSVEATPWYD